MRGVAGLSGTAVFGGLGGRSAAIQVTAKEAKQSKAKQAKQREAKQSQALLAKQSEAKQCKAKQCKQSKAKHINFVSFEQVPVLR